MPLYHFSNFVFDDSRGTLIATENINNEVNISLETKQADTEVQLRNKVANLLSYLIKNKDRVLSKEELLETLWQHGEYRENSLTQSIKELRASLGDKAKAPNFIKTYPQRGYQWIQPTQTVVEDVKVSAVLELLPDEEQDLKNKPNKISPIPKKTQFKNYLLALLVIGLTATIVYWLKVDKEPLSSSPKDAQLNVKNTTSVNSVLVLPFINETQKPSMAWLKLGLADMLANDLERLDSLTENHLNVTPPAMANALMVNAQLTWPALPVHIRSLLKQQNIEAAIFASVRLHNEQQVLDFQIIHANGKDQQGSISYPSLASSLQSVSQQILHVLNPKTKSIDNLKDGDPIASQALAQGMQALQQQGAIYAKKYFQASLLLEQDNYWALAYSARSSIALGSWSLAEEDFKNIPKKVLISDPSLDAFIHFWLAEIAYRRGDPNLNKQVDIALSKAKSASDAKQIARSFRLKAKIAWQKRQWRDHKEWITKANSLFAINDELIVEADKLFYLGTPNNSGLEKAPNNDLQNNQDKLLMALNFYQQLGHKSKIAASKLAIAQNYSFSLTRREDALKSAIKLYEELQQPYELAQALSYAGFFQMQLHDGAKAWQYFNQVKMIAQSIGAQPLKQTSDFYLAFSLLDQGLDQSALGRHGKDEVKLKEAIKYLTTFINSAPSLDLKASALVFLGWANTDLGFYELALEQLKQSKQLNEELNMHTTLAYSSYSIMRIHLEQKNYQAIIDMADEPIITRLQANYIARAYYENNQVIESIKVLTHFKLTHGHLWQNEDDLRLAQYQKNLSGASINLPDAPKAHLVYCESDWQL